MYRLVIQSNGELSSVDLNCDNYDEALNLFDQIKEAEVIIYGGFPLDGRSTKKFLTKLNRFIESIPYKALKWLDPDPIHGSDYTISRLLVCEDLETALIEYGSGSEAEIYLSELDFQEELIPASV